MTKFDCIIMNPPYQRNLHLKVLAEAIKHLRDEESVCVNLSPVRWLQDPLAKYKKTCDLKRFEESVAKHIDSIEPIDQSLIDRMFGIQFNARLGIYDCKKESSAVVKNFLSSKQLKIQELCEKVISKTKVPRITSYKSSKKQNFVPVCLIVGHVKIGEFGEATGFGFQRDRYKWFANGKCQSERFFGKTPEEAKSYNLKSFDTVPVIEFDTPQEAENFYKYITTEFFKKFIAMTMCDGNINPKFLPFPDSFKKTWTNESAAEFFGISLKDIGTIDEDIA